MTKQEVKRAFEQGLTPEIWRLFKADKALLRQEWNNFTDMLCKDGHITQRQYDTLLNPFIKD